MQDWQKHVFTNEVASVSCRLLASYVYIIFTTLVLLYGHVPVSIVTPLCSLLPIRALHVLFPILNHLYASTIDSWAVVHLCSSSLGQVQNCGSGHQLVRLWLWRCRQFVPSSMASPEMTFLPTLQPKYASGHILENIGFSFNLNLSVYDKANSWNFELAWVVTQPMVTLQGQWWRIQNRWYERTSQLYGKWKKKKMASMCIFVAGKFGASWPNSLICIFS